MLNKLAIKSTKAAVMSLECQLAQVQIKRFLNGDNIPEDLLKDLEQHLLACSDCLAVAKGERAAVEAHMIANPAEAVAIRQKMPASSVLDVFKQPKTLMLSIGLGLVLIVMSTILRDPTKLLGTKAIAAHPEAAQQEPETKDTKDEEKPTEDKAKPTEPEVKPTDEHPATTADAKVEPPTPSTTEKPHDETAGQSTPPGPAAAAVKAAQEAAKKGPAPVPGKPTLGDHPIVEVTEGTAKAAPPKTSQPKAAPKAKSTKPAAPRRATSRRPAAKPKTSGNGGVKIYKD